MVVIDIDYPKNGCSTPCPAMRCQKCILKDSVSVFDYIAKERKQDRPDWCPIKCKYEEPDRCLDLLAGSLAYARYSHNND